MAPNDSLPSGARGSPTQGKSQQARKTIVHICRISWASGLDWCCPKQTNCKVNHHQHHWSNVPIDTVSECWQQSLFYPFIDHLIKKHKDCLLQPQERFAAHTLIPSRLEQTTLDDVDNIQKAYMLLICQEHKNTYMPNFDSGVRDETSKVTKKKKKNPQSRFGWSLALTNKQLYPNIHVALVTLIIMLVSSSTSAMQWVKYYLRINMTTERMSNLAVLHAYKDVPVDISEVVHRFSSRKTRRFTFVFEWDES